MKKLKGLTPRQRTLVAVVTVLVVAAVVAGVALYASSLAAAQGAKSPYPIYLPVWLKDGLYGGGRIYLP